jgi:3-oxoacid CoA-transferase subunit A
MIDKVFASVEEAVEGIRSGDSVAIGGFGRAGIPFTLIDAVCDLGLTDLHVISNNAGKDDGGIARLVKERRVRKLTCTFPGHAEFFDQYLRGDVELELVPQGTLAERLRAGGSGLGGFYTPTGASTLLASGGLPTRYDSDGSVLEVQSAKEVRTIDGAEFVLEYPLRPDVGLVKAHRADRYGNLRFRLSARNFNPLCAMAARLAVVEVEHVERDLTLDPDDVHLPGAFVSRVVQSGRGAAPSASPSPDVTGVAR